jgi:fibronectin-binding autotransporter adhesin
VVGRGGRQRLGPAGGPRPARRAQVSASLGKLDVDSWKLQFGVEKALADDVAGGALVAGLTAHYGEASAEVGSRFGGGDLDTKAYGLGATLTWYGAGGGYLDAQGQASWFDSDLKSDLLGARADGVGGQGYGLSLEAGRAFAATEGLSLTPQAQLTYSSIDFDTFVGFRWRRTSRPIRATV